MVKIIISCFLVCLLPFFARCKEYQVSVKQFLKIHPIEKYKLQSAAELLNNSSPHVGRSYSHRERIDAKLDSTLPMLWLWQESRKTVKLMIITAVRKQ